MLEQLRLIEEMKVAYLSLVIGPGADLDLAGGGQLRVAWMTVRERGELGRDAAGGGRALGLTVKAPRRDRPVGEEAEAHATGLAARNRNRRQEDRGVRREGTHSRRPENGRCFDLGVLRGHGRPQASIRFHSVDDG